MEMQQFWDQVAFEYFKLWVRISFQIFLASELVVLVSVLCDSAHLDYLCLTVTLIFITGADGEQQSELC